MFPASHGSGLLAEGFHGFYDAWVALKGMAYHAVVRLPFLGIAVLVFFAFYFIAKGVRNVVRRVSRRYQRAHNAGLVFGRLAQAVLVIVGLLVALAIAVPSIKASDVIGFLGISSVAIGFAFREVLQNFLAGILLLLTEPFRIGDQIRIGDYEGTVEEIQTRATLMKTYDGRRIVIPNSNLFTSSVVVNTAHPHRRLEYDVGIGYGDDIARARDLILEAVRETEGVLKDPAPDVIVVALAESSVNLRARWWVNPPRQLNVMDKLDTVLEAIKNKLQANGIDLPYPTRQVLFHDQTETTDGDRAKQREGWPAGQGPVPQPRTIGGALRRLARRDHRHAPHNTPHGTPHAAHVTSDGGQQGPPEAEGREAGRREPGWKPDAGPASRAQYAGTGTEPMGPASA